MTDHVRTMLDAARAGGRPLARAVTRAALCALLAGLVSAVSAQTPTWEAMPGVRRLPSDPDPINAVDWLRGEGAQADDPAADSLVVFGTYGTLLYNPSGAAGAAGSNGEWGAWHPLCVSGLCSGTTGVVTGAGTLVVGGSSRRVSRSTDRGRTWARHTEEIYPMPIFESSLPSLVGPTGAGALFGGGGFEGETTRSLSDGVEGTWQVVLSRFGMPQSFGEVPPSASLPNGRILYGVWNGIVYSDDGGLTYAVSSAYGQAAYIAYSFAFVAQAGHPYGGVTYAGVHDIRAGGEFAGGSVLRSDDGGATWTLAHRFTAAELDMALVNGADLSQVIVYATPDGALWAAVSFGSGASTPSRGGIARSTDGGATWTRADEGYRDATGRGYQANQLRLGRDGRLYAATTRGVWRTTGPAVAGEASPAPSGAVGVTVRPNPARSRVEIVVTGAERASVEVYDGLGRRVWQGETQTVGAQGGVAALDTAGWPSGVYVVRAVVGGRALSARLVVAR